MDPAAERVVPTALKTTEGLGVRVERRGAHCEVLDSRRDSSLGCVRGELGEEEEEGLMAGLDGVVVLVAAAAVVVDLGEAD